MEGNEGEAEAEEKEKKRERENAARARMATRRRRRLWLNSKTIFDFSRQLEPTKVYYSFLFQGLEALEGERMGGEAVKEKARKARAVSKAKPKEKKKF